ncbi:MAG: MlaD family protein [Candidatus Binatus sp.]|uniref:PqiB family protein n=1 Tax=Candidatus Binatus sp. TaxID=2811406 RepID=UPI002722120D|nr:MlaD family protein [Candidatus Binatus sp.]MDO8433467.1 MlaD family protein [Candidatus Binatus sp.]
MPKKRTRFSLVWVIPVLAAIVGAWVAVTRILSEGPKITIVFRTAEGLEAGKTKIHYNGVDVGTLTAIQLSDDHKHVITTAQMAPKTEGFLVNDTKFWVVKPRISGANVTGLGTLISGAYIGMEIGASKEDRRDFVALETQPVITGEVPGRFFVLKTPDLGSIDTGTPIYFRRLQVGQVASYNMDQNGKALTVKAFVRAPYDQYVNGDTRFWHASGIDLSLTASGLSVQTQSALSILIGGIAFETAPSVMVQPPAEEHTAFTLYGNRAEAFNPPPRNPQTYQLIFTDSVRGLVAGAPVEFRGIRVGEVADITAQIDLKTFKFSVPVTIRLDPQRLGVKIFELGPTLNLESMRRKLIDSLVSHGVRAQLRTGNLLTGSAFVSLDFFPGAPPATVDWSQQPVQLPTIRGTLEATEETVENIIAKIDKMPLKEIGDELRKAIADLDLTLTSARGALDSAHSTLDNANTLVAPNSLQLEKLDQTLDEVSRAAQSLRVLADFLERHPEALLRGKKGEAK